MELQAQVFKVCTYIDCLQDEMLNQSIRVQIKRAKDIIFWKKILENKEMEFKYGVINIQAMGYNGAFTVY